MKNCYINSLGNSGKDGKMSAKNRNNQLELLYINIAYIDS